MKKKPAATPSTKPADQPVGKAKPGTARAKLGALATIWWGVTGLWVVAVVWSARNAVARGNAWSPSLRQTISSHWILIALSIVVLVGWLGLAVKWLYILKKDGISYKAAFTDLFLTIRR